MRGLFVTGTDTGVGKTILSSALLAAMSAEGERVSAYKPVLTGLDEQADTSEPGDWPTDDVLLGTAACLSAQDVAPLRYGPAVSPHLAAELAGERIDPERLLAGVPSPPSGGEGVETLVVEGVGGLLTPLAGHYTVRDFAAALKLPLLIAARPGLGTINHTLLTLQAARSAGLDVRAVVLTPWAEEPTGLERSNRTTIADLGSVEVGVLSVVQSPDRRELACAGASLPWRRWLRRPSAS
jgi:dethiobiotin synthetase